MCESRLASYSPLHPHILNSNFENPSSIGTTSETHFARLEAITYSASHLLGIINDIITLRAGRSGLQVKQDLVRDREGGTR